MCGKELPNGFATEETRLENSGKETRKKCRSVERPMLLGQHQIKWVWVKGHGTNPENERCDESGAPYEPTQVDSGYRAEASHPVCDIAGWRQRSGG